MTAQNVLVIGRAGQVASALERLSDASSLNYCCRNRDVVDLTRPSSLQRAIDDVRPEMVVNAAAYTAVDKAEEEPAIAHAVNAEGPGALAALCQKSGIPLIHLSTDYVFDGTARKPYRVDDPVQPLGVYGESKLAGDLAVREELSEHVILRTAWVFSEGGRNFVTTMLRLGAVRLELRVVDDQVGSPTYAADIAAAIDAVARRQLEAADARHWGTYHFTNTGEVSWCGFANEIFRLAALRGSPAPTIVPIPTQAYPTPARRPAYSVLDTSLIRERFGISSASWQNALERCMAAMSRPEDA